MTRVNVASQAPTIVDFHMDEAPEFEVEREDESGDVVLTITTDAGDKVRINIGRFYDSASSLVDTLRSTADDVKANILTDWQDTPDEFDGWVSEGRDGYYVRLEGTELGGRHGYASRDIAVYELAKAMADSGCFPNAWYQNERGNVDDIAYEVRKYHDEGGDKMLPLEGVEYGVGDRIVSGDQDWWVVEQDYGQLGIVAHVWGDPTVRTVIEDRSEVTRNIECAHCGKRLVRDIAGSTDAWYAVDPEPGTAPGICEDNETGAHEPEDD